MSADPHAIVTDAISDGVFDNEARLAERVLLALRAAGWRIVRSDPCRNPYVGLGRCGCSDITITEEWTPAQLGAARGQGSSGVVPGQPRGADGEGVTAP